MRMLEPTTDEFNQKVCQKFNTSLQQVKKDVEVLKEWIRQQPHLPQCSSDALLTNFLIACKNRMERAKEKIDNYYTARLEIPDFFGHRDPEDERVQQVSAEIRIFTLPKMTPDGCRITMSTFVTGDVDKFDITAFCKRLMCHADIKFEHESLLMGDYVVLDAKHFSLSHVTRLTPTLASNIIRCIQDVMPVIVKNVIIFNAPTYMEMVLSILRPFTKGKLMQKFHIHSGGPEMLENYFPRDLLPCDYGGKEDTSSNLNEAWLQCMQQNRSWLLKEGSLTVDEKKRPANKTTSRRGVGLHELQGSFKTLCVD